MPRAEPGTAKFASKQLKLRGLQRLRWYCQICQKQTRDENSFKQHTLSEGHVRAMQLVAEDPKKWINEYSKEFQRNFLQLLRTSHGEKQIHINRFYQEYISDKSHVHLNSTRWPSLTEFAKYLGREGICRVEEKEDGFFIQWIDNSPEAIRRREKLEKGNRQEEYEVQEQKEILKQVERAHQNATPSHQEAPSELDKGQWTDFKVDLGSNPKPKPTYRVQKPTKKGNVFASKKRKQSSQSGGSSSTPSLGGENIRPVAGT